MTKKGSDNCRDTADTTRCAETVQLAAFIRRHPAMARATARVDETDNTKRLEVLCDAFEPDQLRAEGVPLPSTAATDFSIEDKGDGTTGKTIRICPVITLGIPPLTVSVPLECRDVEIPFT